MNYTPGPWRKTVWTDGISYTVDGRGGKPLANITGQSEDNEANATLIAAAPDLLKAAKMALEWIEACEQGKFPAHLDTIEALRASINLCDSVQ